MKKIIALLFFLGWALPAFAGTFFIDNSATGCAGAPCSNANAGTSPNTAWLDTSKISAVTVTGGDQYLFKRGDVFRYPSEAVTDMIAVGTFNSAASNARVIWGAYGSGNKPIINGSHCHGSANATVTPPFAGAVAQANPCSGATPGTWTLDTGSPGVPGNIYKLTYNTSYIHNIVVDGPTGDSVFPANTTSGSGYGLSWAACKTGTCAGSTTTMPAAWATGVIAAGQCRVNAVQGFGEWFCTPGGGTAATAAPQCTIGTCVFGANTGVTGDTGITDWTFEGVSGFAQGAMTAGTAYFDGATVFVSMPDGSDPGTHSIEFVTHLHGFRSNANNSEKNYQTVQGLHFTRLGEGLRFFSNGSAGNDNCQGGHIIANNIIDGIGEPNADDGQFLTVVRFSQGSAGSCNTTTTAHPSIFIGNRFDHSGARGLTIQAAPFGLEAENEGTFCPHSAMNDVSVVSQADNGLVSYHNKIHDIHHSLTYNQTFIDTGVGMYFESSNNLTVAMNTIYDVVDPNCSTAQCDCIQLFGNTGTTVVNNTCNNAQNGIYLSNGCASAIVENNLISNLSGGSAGTTQLPMNLNNTCCTTVDYNLLTSAATVGNYNSLAKTFAQWNTAGFDSNGKNANATYLSNAYPFQQSTSSVGYQAGDASQGFGRNIGANQYGTMTR